MIILDPILRVAHAFEAPVDPALLIAAELSGERLRQILVEQRTRERDDCRMFDELPRAATVYALYCSLSDLDRENAARFGPAHYGANVLWPWGNEAFKLTDRRRDLVKAGALIIAEIERLDRAAQRKAERVASADFLRHP